MNSSIPSLWEKMAQLNDHESYEWMSTISITRYKAENILWEKTVNEGTQG